MGVGGYQRWWWWGASVAGVGGRGEATVERGGDCRVGQRTGQNIHSGRQAIMLSGERPNGRTDGRTDR